MDRAGSWVSGILTDGRSQKGQVGTGGWEEDKRSGKKEGSGQKQGMRLLEGQRETSVQPKAGGGGGGVNVSFVQHFMAPCQRARSVTAQGLKPVTG